MPVITQFENEVKNNNGSGGTEASTIVWLDNQNSENESLIEDKKEGEKRIGLAQDDEIKTWLTNHIQ